ncbi:MAG: hypothetical protein UX60_C0018G0008 [Berkelbacteria bacterium GW2011_GWA2_46_7]|uniref:Uncharacterized protein n=1 Tax=Berkelbacteria bacterium GW2011_GWA2_46_7 TaxID=1618335 RepID=A0A0G1QFE3_9BACT|nr:MAG: hypothetical protein UX60_C0018G0008 [Berkelbacteria bacterium GW2011_GWA2_46_7]
MPDNNAERSVIADVLSNAPAGTQATAQSASQPSHHHAGQTSGPTHNDATAGTKQSDGSISYEKIHSDDK